MCVCAWITFLYSHNKRLTSYDSTRIDINCIIVYRRIVLCQQIDVPNRRIALFIKTTTNLPSIDFLQTCNRYRYTNIFVGIFLYMKTSKQRFMIFFHLLSTHCYFAFLREDRWSAESKRAHARTESRKNTKNEKKEYFQSAEARIQVKIYKKKKKKV